MTSHRRPVLQHVAALSAALVIIGAPLLGLAVCSVRGFERIAVAALPFVLGILGLAFVIVCTDTGRDALSHDHFIGRRR